MAHAADVVIVGGGITGTSIAYHLRKRGIGATVLERTWVGAEASGRNGGGVRQQGRDPRELKLAMRSIARWPSLGEELGADLEYRREGNLSVALDEERSEELRALAEDQRARGLEVHHLSGPELRELAPYLSAGVLSANYCPTDGHANPILATKAFGRAARALGAEVREGEEVVAVERDERGVAAVLTRGARYATRTVVNCAGVWASSVGRMAGVETPVRPRLTQILVTEALKRCIPQFVGYSFGYMRQTVRGHLHLGLSSEFVDEYGNRTTSAAILTLARRLPEVFNMLHGVRVLRGWGGMTAWNAEEVPLIGPAASLPGYYQCVGFTGHGFALGPAVGELMARLLDTGEVAEELAPLIV